jgi:hypothetical protein
VGHFFSVPQAWNIRSISKFVGITSKLITSFFSSSALSIMLGAFSHRGRTLIITCLVTAETKDL